jgi:AcrR family transcriptional regulator
MTLIKNAPPDEVDFRKRSAARRSAHMRERLIESALISFSKKGLETTLIDDVIKTADVSRGTFYKHFASMSEILVAVAEEVNNEVMTTIESIVRDIESADERIYVGLSLVLETAREYPRLASFARSTGLASLGPTSMLYELLPVHLNAGIEAKLFPPLQIDVALDLLAGGMQRALARMADTPVDQTYRREIVKAIMRGVGMSEARIAAQSGRYVKGLKLPADSLLVRVSEVGSHRAK